MPRVIGIVGEHERINHRIPLREHILDRQTNLAHMQHLSGSKGFLSFVIQVVVHNQFKDIVVSATRGKPSAV